MNTPLIGKLTAEDLNDVQTNARSKSYRDVSKPSAVPKLVARILAVPIALASIVSVSLVAALSFGCHGVAMVLGRISPLRDAYQFLDRAYERFMERLGREVLRDTRDTPALRIMVSLTLTAVPIFVTQLVLGKPRLLLVIAFYISLYGLKFQRSIRMFSAKHMEAHRPHGYFSEKYAR